MWKYFIAEANEWKILIKQVLCDDRCKFEGGKYNLKQKYNNDKCRYDFEEPIEHRVYQ